MLKHNKMNSAIKQLSTTMITLMISCSLLLANTTDVDLQVLTDNDWKKIEENAELDAMLDIMDLPTLNEAEFSVLTDQDWDAIKRDAELNSMLNLDGLPGENDVLYPTLTEAEWTQIKDEAVLNAMLDFWWPATADPHIN